MRAKTTSLPNLQLTPEQIKSIQLIIQKAKGIFVLGRQLTQILDSQQEFFNQTEAFLGLLEGIYYKTYYDSEEILSIGIGFNLQQSGASDIIKNLGLDYSQLMQGEGEPPGGISDIQVADLFKVTLLGSSLVPSWVGKAQQLQSLLINNGLGDTVFTGPEVIAMLSLVYQEGEKLFGPGLITAIKFYKQTGDPLSVVSQLVECSNREKSTGISNRRLCEAALFASATLTPDRIVLPYRQQQYILQEAGLT